MGSPVVTSRLAKGSDGMQDERVELDQLKSEHISSHDSWSNDPDPGDLTKMKERMGLGPVPATAVVRESGGQDSNFTFGPTGESSKMISTPKMQSPGSSLPGSPRSKEAIHSKDIVVLDRDSGV